MPKIGHFSFYLPPAGSRDLHAREAIRPLKARAFLREPRTPVPASVTAVLDGAILLSGTRPVKRDWVPIASKIEIASRRKVLPRVSVGAKSVRNREDGCTSPHAARRAASTTTPTERRAHRPSPAQPRLHQLRAHLTRRHSAAMRSSGEAASHLGRACETMRGPPPTIRPGVRKSYPPGQRPSLAPRTPKAARHVSQHGLLLAKKHY
jgi:hypothetical protein